MKLGDAIEKVTQATGLDKLAEKAAEANEKSDCGCGRSKQLFNDGQYIEGTKQLASNAVDLVKGVTKMLIHPSIYTAKVGEEYRLNIGEGFSVEGEAPGLSVASSVFCGIPTQAGTFPIVLVKGPIRRSVSILVNE